MDFMNGGGVLLNIKGQYICIYIYVYLSFEYGDGRKGAIECHGMI